MDQTIAHLRALNARFIHNYVTNDVAAHDALLHQHFTYISGSGERVGRQRYLLNWASGFEPALIPYWDTRDERIVLHGDIALVSAVNKYVERQGGAAQTAMAAYTDCYVLEGGKWLCLQAQITPVDPRHWPDDSTIVNVYVNGVLQSSLIPGG